MYCALDRTVWFRPCCMYLPLRGTRLQSGVRFAPPLPAPAAPLRGIHRGMFFAAGRRARGGTLNGLIVMLFGQPRFSTWRRAALRPAPPPASGSRRPRGARAYDLSHSADTNARKTDRQTGTDGRGGPRARIPTIPTLKFEETRPLFSQAHGDISSVNKQMSHRRQTVTRRTRCTPAPSRGLSASFKV